MITLPAGRLYLTPEGGAEEYLGETDGADIEVSSKVDEAWKPGRGGLVLADAAPYRADTVITVRCLDSRDLVMEMGLMLQRDTSVPGRVRLIPRSDLSVGAVVALRHAPAPASGHGRSLYVARALCLPNGKVPLKRKAQAGDVQAVDLQFRVMAVDLGPDFYFEELL